ncbi:hypothetical protein [Methylobacterium sp. NFXW15]|uniref:hypothetical protein n=1 Tax=Methylobacterium sp. NFXW15 TaxID=2819512 RepID=UPI003CE84FDA
MKRLSLFALTLLIPASVLSAEPEPRPRFCAEDLPEGVRLPGTPPCPATPNRKPKADGFRDLGNGLSVRIGGRVSAEYGMNR